MIKGLYDEFANRWYRGGQIYLYSDPHFDDDEMKNIRKNYIGDDEQVKRINKKVGKNDTIVILGDVGNLEYVKKIRGYKVLIMGNHDTGATKFKRVTEVRKAQFKINEEEIKKIKDDWGRIEGPADWASIQVNIEKYINTCIRNEFRSKYEFVDTKLIYKNNSIKIEYDDNLDEWYFYYEYDNKLFDEVYEGSLQISPKIMLSHEQFPIYLFPYCINFHGHDHAKGQQREGCINLCAEFIDYTPVALKSFLDSGLFKTLLDVHRTTIDHAIERKNKKLQK